MNIPDPALEGRVAVVTAGRRGTGGAFAQAGETWRAATPTPVAMSSIRLRNRGVFGGGDAYDISKAGVIMLTGVLASDMGKYWVRVNATAPSVFRTQMTQRLWNNPQAPGGGGGQDSSRSAQ